MLSRFVSFLLNFQLTTSQGGRPVLALTVDLCCALSTHDLTRRSTVVIPTQLIIGISFNSRPHKEVDYMAARLRPSYDPFQLTTSQGGRLVITGVRVTEYSFQLTTSQGGRPLTRVLHFGQVPFQLTTSQGGRQSKLTTVLLADHFQLTTSQGGRRLSKYSGCI